MSSAVAASTRISSKPIVLRESIGYITHHLQQARALRSHEDLEFAAREISQMMRHTGAFPILLNLHIAVSRAQIVVGAISDSEAGAAAADEALDSCLRNLRRLCKGSEVI